MGNVSSPAARIISLSAVLLAIATGAVTLRILSTRIRKRKLQVHDLLCILSLVDTCSAHSMGNNNSIGLSSRLCHRLYCW